MKTPLRILVAVAFCVLLSGAARAVSNAPPGDELAAPSTIAIWGHWTYQSHGASVEVASVWCSGTAIAKDLVLTAAHCKLDNPWVYDASITDVVLHELRVSSQNDLTLWGYREDSAAAPPASVRAIQWEPHPGYAECVARRTHPCTPDQSGCELCPDVALLHLDEPLDVEPAGLASRAEVDALTAGARVTLAGYGRTRNDRDDFAVLRLGETTLARVLPLAVTTLAGGAIPQICRGDSGGSMLIDDAHGAPTRLLAVSTWGSDATICNDTGGVRVDTFADWIDLAPKPGGGCSTEAASAPGDATWLLPLAAIAALVAARSRRSRPSPSART